MFKEIRSVLFDTPIGQVGALANFEHHQFTIQEDLDKATQAWLNERTHVQQKTELETNTISSKQANLPTLVCLHGYLDNANSFLPMLNYLPDYPCIAIDLAGHGASFHRSADAHYHLTDYAYDLMEIINSLGLDSFVLVGHSLGAIVSSIFASTCPDNLKGFLAIESCGPLSESEASSATQLKASFESRQKARKPIKQPSSVEALIKARCSISDLEKAEAETILFRNIIDSDNGIIWRTDKKLRTKSSLRFTENQAQNLLSSIACPRALILASKGFDKVKRGVEQRKYCFSNVKIDQLEGGHHVHMTAARESAKLLRSFLNESIE